MATRRAAANADRDNQVAALIPVNKSGEPVDVNGQDWQMPAGGPAPGPDDVGGYGGEMVTLPNEDDEPQSASDRIIAMLSGVADDERAYLKVSRVSGNKISWCADYSPADFEAGGLNMIRNQWGSGEFKIVLYGTQPGTKQFSIRTRTTVMIEAPLQPAAIAAPQSELAMVLKQMQEQQAQMLAALTARPEPKNPMDDMKAMFSMMSMMREAMGLNAPAAPAKSQLSEIVSAMRELREVSEEINPQKETGPLAMVGQIMPLVQAAMAERQALAAQQQPRPVPRLAHAVPAPNPSLPPNGVPAQLPDQPSPTTHEEKPAMTAEDIAELQKCLADLVQMAMDGKPTEDGADLVYEKLPDEMIALMQEEKWFDTFKLAAPAAAPYEAWFQTARNQALALFADPDAGDAPAR